VGSTENSQWTFQDWISSLGTHCFSLSPAPVSFRSETQVLATFLRNHREVITTMHFFTVPTLTFRVWHCFFIVEHGRRKILHFNVTENPTGPGIVQLREAFRESCPCRSAILDRDIKVGVDVTDLLASSGTKPRRSVSEVSGKMESRNAGLEVVKENFSTKLLSMRFICAV